MYITCLDVEGVLVPEIWVAFAEASGIPELKRTTRDEPDYKTQLLYFRSSYYFYNYLYSRITATCLYVSVYLQTRCWERSVCLLYWIYFIFRIAWLVAIFHKKFASRTCTFPFPKLLYFDSFFHRFITVYDFLDSIHKILSEQGILTSL